ncbi:Arc family DNA-binding protein [Yersinia enterocolitica]|nr:Arc family DNA-binding protein [Yersinia enterocolitica]EKN3768984.1 Arc family DNA-binding protein [Yersinia enterocolitica]EKN4083708.1 Arc family DNA-binding protein [Yersinia enterocolitica]EKN6170484.1 Arc family DNA-binding protein [Yersinia enterocolitica]EKN6398895.1 Arc family DNA-binding protein [Yersinia enterocolitica]
MKVRDIAPYGIRMPAELKEKLQEIAKKNSRSLNSEIVHILEDFVSPPKVDDIRLLSDEELRSPEKLQAWMKELTTKLSTIEKVVKKNFPEDK